MVRGVDIKGNRVGRGQTTGFFSDEIIWAISNRRNGLTMRFFSPPQYRFVAQELEHPLRQADRLDALR